MLNKIDLVSPKSLTLNEDSWFEIPEKVVMISERDRETQRKIMLNVPRDAKGRWL